jgi:hypothetical protein
MKLKKTQRLLWRLITAPEGVDKALRKNPAKLPVEKTGRMSAAERLDIYANMYFFRILDSLKDDFSRVLEKIGETSFHNLITDYLLAHPPTHWSLRYAGRRLPAFLKKHPLGRKKPNLSDLARFEWEILEAFDAHDADLLREEDLRAIPPKAWPKLKLKLAPAFRFGRLEGKPTAIWRKDFKVLFRKIDPTEESLLKKIKKGEPFEKWGAFAAKKKSPMAVTNYLRTWIQDGFFSKI